MDKRTIIAVVICVLLLLFWGRIMEFLGYAPATPQKTQTQQTAVDTTAVPAATQPVVTPSDTLPPEHPIIEAVDTLVAEKTVEVRTPLYRMILTNYGGGIQYLELRNYKYQGNGDVILTQSSNKVVPDFETANGTFKANHLRFQCDQNDFQLEKGDSPRKITFTYDNDHGGRIIKTFTINPDRYDVDFDITVDGIESFGFERNYDLVWGITPAPTEKNLKDDYSYYKVVGMMDKNIDLADFENGRMSEDLPGVVLWAGLRTKYFAAIMIPRNRFGDGITARGTETKEEIGGASIKVRDLAAGLTLSIPSQGTVVDSFTIFAGPIDYKILKKYNNSMEELTSLGWIIIKPFSIAIIWLLPKIYSIVPNYGVVVLIFSLLVKVLIFPLSRKQTLAMTKMKELQPKMKKLQEKYKEDPGRLNKEMMKLYKETGANPLSGCLPLLPQMPLFFALFTVFKTTIEFRGASFVGWITDLSVPDPLYILPIIMVITMFIQQKMTMTDPKQKMMVYIMPLFFGWLFMNFPAGLVLYWTGFNILSFIETIYVRKRQEAVTVVEESK